MEFKPFDKRQYPVTTARSGYGEWAAHYEETVAVELDRRLLDSIGSVNWPTVGAVADLACGTGRMGVFLSQHGVGPIDGVDITPEMLELAREKRLYRSLEIRDVADTDLPSSSYDLCTLILADEHLAAVEPVYREAARLLAPGGSFILLGYHPFFLMAGTPTHYHRADGEPVAIQSYVHLFSEHFKAGIGVALTLIEFQECRIDDEWLRSKPKWHEYRNWPVSFMLVWRHRGGK